MKFEDLVTFFKRKAADCDGAAQVAHLFERLVQTPGNRTSSYQQTCVSPVCSAAEALSLAPCAFSEDTITIFSGNYPHAVPTVSQNIPDERVTDMTTSLRKSKKK